MRDSIKFSCSIFGIPRSNPAFYIYVCDPNWGVVIKLTDNIDNCSISVPSLPERSSALAIRLLYLSIAMHYLSFRKERYMWQNKAYAEVQKQLRPVL